MASLEEAHKESAGVWTAFRGPIVHRRPCAILEVNRSRLVPFAVADSEDHAVGIVVRVIERYGSGAAQSRGVQCG
jgi:hypothetical protein